MKRIDTKKLKAIMAKKGITVAQLGNAAGVTNAAIYRILNDGYCRETTAIQLASALKTSSFVIGDMPPKSYGACGNRVVNINTSALSAAWAARKMSNAEFKDYCGTDGATVNHIIKRGTCLLWSAEAIAKGLGIPLESFVLENAPERATAAEPIEEPDKVAAEPEAEQTEEPEAAPTDVPTDKGKALGEKIWDRIFEAHLQGYAEQRNVEYKRLTDIFYEDAEPTLAEVIAIAKCAGWSLDEMLRRVTPSGQQKTISELLLIVIFDQIKTLISNRSGITKERLGIIFNGDEDPTITEVVAISDAFGLSLDELLKGV